MKTYTVNMTRIGYGHCSYEVTAKNLKEARRIAMDESGSHNYSEHDADYKIEDICESE